MFLLSVARRIQHFFQSSLRRNLMAFFGVLFAASILVWGIGFSFLASTSEMNFWEQRQRETARHAGQTVTNLLQETEHSLYLLDALGPAALTNTPEPLHRALQLNPAFNEIVYLDAAGQVIASASRDHPLLANLFTIPQSRWFQLAHTGNHYLSSLQFSTDDEPYVVIALPSTNGAVIAARLRMDVLWDVVNDLPIGASGNVYIVNREGQLITHSRVPTFQQPQDIHDQSEFAAMIAPVDTWYGSATTLAGKTAMAASYRIPDSDWVIVVDVTRQEIFSASQRLILTLIVSLLVFSFMLIKVVRETLTRVLFAPLEHLRLGAEKIGQGNLAHQIPLTTHDEMSQVTRAFNQMALRLKEREAQLLRITENMNDVITEIDAAGNIGYASPSHLWVLGIPPALVVGKPIWERLHPDDATQAVLALSAVLNDPHASHSITVRYQHADGNYVWMECVGNPVTNERGEITALVLSSRDVTERKLAEAQLRQLNDQLELRVRERTAELAAVNAQLEQGIVERQRLVDRQTVLYETLCAVSRFLNINQVSQAAADAIAQMTQWAHVCVVLRDDARGEWVVRGASGRLAAEVGTRCPITRGVIGRVFTSGKTQHVPDVRHDPDYVLEASSTLLSEVAVPFQRGDQLLGALNIESDQCNAFNAEDLALIHLLAEAVALGIDNARLYEAAQQEIAERKLAEQALRENEEKYRLHFENVTDVIYSLDTELRIVTISPSVEKALGYPPRELIGKTISEINFLEPAYFEQAMRDTVLVFEGKQTTSQYAFIARDGTRKIAEITGSPIFSAGEIIGIVSVARDITERQQMQDLLQLRFRLAEFAAAHSLSELLEKTLDEIGELTHSPIGFYHFVEADQQTLSLQAWSSKTKSAYCRAEGAGLHYSLDQAGVWADCAREQRPIIHNDYAALAHKHGLPSGHAPLIRELVVPIMRQNKVVAILGVGNKPQDYTDQDAEMVLYLADVAWGLTEQKRAEEALRESEQRFRSLYENATIGIYRTTPSGEIQLANPTLVRMLGYSSFAELAQVNLEQNNFHADAPRQNFRDRIEQEGQVRGLESIWVKRDGAMIFVRESARANIDSAGNVLYYEGTVEDITVTKRMENELRESETRFRSVFDRASVGIALVDTQGCVLDANEADCLFLGYPKDELIGMHFTQFTHPDDLAIDTMQFQKLMRGEIERYTIDKRYIRKDGQVVIGRLNVSVIRDVAGNIRYTLVICADVTIQKQMETALRESEDRYALAARGANDGLFDWNLDTHEVYYSPRWKEMLGCAEHEIGTAEAEWFQRIHPADLAQLQADLRDHLQGNSQHFESECRILHADGRYRWMLCRGVAVRDEQHHAYRFAGSQTDITRRKNAEERLLHDALHEPLTGLPNRVLFMDRVAQILRITQRDLANLSAVLFLDLDRFKTINDSLGHHIGDLVLVEAARRLEHCVRPGDTVARFGGDEFAILLNNLKNPNDALSAAERVQKDLGMPFQIDGHPLSLSTSIGITLIPAQIGTSSLYAKPEEVIRDADTAMYRAKALGKARHLVFDKSWHSYAVEQLQIEADLRHAIDHEELLLYYQPVLTAHNSVITSVEALLRWQHPARGLVPPSAFIPVAEESGLILPMGKWVLQTACRQIAEWRAHGFPHLRMAINFSARQFQDPQLVRWVSETLQTYRLPGDALQIEITESTAMRDMEQSTRILTDLDRMGVEISIDDFGNSYSALGYLKRFPFDILKIDQGFLRDITHDVNNAAITTAIIAMARALKLRVIAEGVETFEQLEFLRSRYCDEIQGYYFSRPIPAAAMTQLLRQTPGVHIPHSSQPIHD